MTHSPLQPCAKYRQPPIMPHSTHKNRRKHQYTTPPTMGANRGEWGAFTHHDPVVRKGLPQDPHNTHPPSPLLRQSLYVLYVKRTTTNNTQNSVSHRPLLQTINFAWSRVSIPPNIPFFLYSEEWVKSESLVHLFHGDHTGLSRGWCLFARCIPLAPHLYYIPTDENDRNPVLGLVTIILNKKGHYGKDPPLLDF